MQTAKNFVPGGFVAYEFQEAARFVWLPTARELAEQMFKRPEEGGAEWFVDEVERVYNWLLKKLHWNTKRDGPLYFLAYDKDPRHSWRDMDAAAANEGYYDRTLGDAGELNSIKFYTAIQELPSCKRVPDCIQCPVEMTFGPVKREIHKRMVDMAVVGSYEIATLVQDVCKELITPDKVKNCFAHGVKAIRCFKGLKTDTITVEVHGRVWIVHCSHGDWVPIILAG